MFLGAKKEERIGDEIPSHARPSSVLPLAKFLENIAGTLKELWCSYNKIKVLDNVTSCKKLEVLYISNNELKGYEELDKLVS